MDYAVWTDAELEALTTFRKRLGKGRGGPISALYLMASSTQEIVRAGAIGVSRKFDVVSQSYAGGNTAKARLRQYNANMDSEDSKTTKLPWSAIPWTPIWLAQFARADVTPAEIAIAEQVLHFRIADAGFGRMGSSCYRCIAADRNRLIEVGATTMQAFRDFAPQLLGRK